MLPSFCVDLPGRATLTYTVKFPQGGNFSDLTFIPPPVTKLSSIGKPLAV